MQVEHIRLTPACVETNACVVSNHIESTAISKPLLPNIGFKLTQLALPCMEAVRKLARESKGRLFMWSFSVICGEKGGDNGFDHEFHTLLIQTFAPIWRLATRLSTEVRICCHSDPSAHAARSKARETHPAPHATEGG